MYESTSFQVDLSGPFTGVSALNPLNLYTPYKGGNWFRAKPDHVRAGTKQTFGC